MNCVRSNLAIVIENRTRSLRLNGVGPLLHRTQIDLESLAKLNFLAVTDGETCANYNQGDERENDRSFYNKLQSL